jgi:hypothetical protein
VFGPVGPNVDLRVLGDLGEEAVGAVEFVVQEVCRGRRRGLGRVVGRGW